MRRRFKKGRVFFYILSLCLVPCTVSFAANIAVVKSRDISAYNTALEGFEAALITALPGEDVDVWVAADLMGKKILSSRVVSSIKEGSPDLIVTLGSAATEVVREEFTDIPVVFSMVLDPVGNGYVNSMVSSGNNLSGSCLDISVKSQLEELAKVLPGVTTIGVIYSSDKNRKVAKKASKVASSMGLELVSEWVASEGEIPSALDGLSLEVDALWSITDSTVFTPHSTQYILLNTLRNNLPFMALSPTYVKAGALMALSIDYEDVGRQAGEIAARIINGEQPSSIPIATPRKTHLSLNLRVADQINVDIPSGIITSAKDVFR